jgi:hypothetical protein
VDARWAAALRPGFQAAVARWLGSQGRIRWPRIAGAPVEEAAPARLAASSIGRAPLSGIGTEPIGVSRRRRTPSHVLPLHRNTVNTAVFRTRRTAIPATPAMDSDLTVLLVISNAGSPSQTTRGWMALRNSTPDPLHAIDARVVHVAMHHLAYPHNRAGERCCRGLWGGVGWGGVRLRVAQFLANLWQHTASSRCADPVDACRADAGRPGAHPKSTASPFWSYSSWPPPVPAAPATVAAATTVTLPSHGAGEGVEITWGKGSGRVPAL